MHEGIFMFPIKSCFEKLISAGPAAAGRADGAVPFGGRSCVVLIQRDGGVGVGGTKR